MFFFIPRNFFDRSNWMPIESEDENLNGVCEETALQVTSSSIGTSSSASTTSNDETVMMSSNTIDKYYSSSRGGSSMTSHPSSQPEAARLSAIASGSRSSLSVRDVLSDCGSECESESEASLILGDFNDSEADSDSD